MNDPYLPPKTELRHVPTVDRHGLDGHDKACAWLRIVAGGLLGLLALGLLVAFILFSDRLVQDMASDGQAAGAAFVKGIGYTVLIFLLLFSAAEVAAGMLYLRGVKAAKYALIAFGVFGLVNIPLGTALGIYTIWALTRNVAQPPSSPTR